MTHALAPALMIQGDRLRCRQVALVAGSRAPCATRPERAPFKPQNMSNNAAVDRGRRRDRPRPGPAGAGRRAYRRTSHMNPVLLKPRDRHRRAGDRAGQAHRDVARARLSARSRSCCRRCWRVSRVCPRCRSRSGGGCRQSGRGQPARGRHRQHGICRCGRRAGRAGRRHRPRRRHRAASSAPRRCSTGRCAHASSGFRDQQVSRRCRLFDDGLPAIEQKTGWPSLGVVPWLPQAGMAAGRGCARSERARKPRPMRVTIAVPRCRASPISTISIRSSSSLASSS